MMQELLLPIDNISNKFISLSRIEEKADEKMLIDTTRQSSTSDGYSLVYKNSKLFKVPKADLWFWTKEWQIKENEVEKSLKLGKGKVFDSIEDLFDEL